MSDDKLNTIDQPPRGRVWLRDVIAAFEREARNTDTDPRWRAAAALRDLEGWWSRTVEVTLHV
jgi:hypothetical protein